MNVATVVASDFEDEPVQVSPQIKIERTLNETFFYCFSLLNSSLKYCPLITRHPVSQSIATLRARCDTQSSIPVTNSVLIIEQR